MILKPAALNVLGAVRTARHIQYFQGRLPGKHKSAERHFIETRHRNFFLGDATSGTWGPGRDDQAGGGGGDREEREGSGLCIK